MAGLHAEISIKNSSFQNTGIAAEIYSIETENSTDSSNLELNNRTMELWASGNAYSLGGAIGIFFEVSPCPPDLGSPSKFLVEITDTEFANIVAGSNSTLFPPEKWSYDYGGGAVFLYSSMEIVDSVAFRSVVFFNCT